MHCHEVRERPILPVETSTHAVGSDNEWLSRHQLVNMHGERVADVMIAHCRRVGAWRAALSVLRGTRANRPRLCVDTVAAFKFALLGACCV